MIHLFDLIIEYFGFGTGGIDPTIAMIVWAIYIGIMIACFVAVYQKNVVGKFVRTLLSAQATSPETAKNLEELGYGKKLGIRRHLRGKTALSSIVYEQGKDLQKDKDGNILPAIRDKVNFARDKFYIPDELKHRAEIRFEKKGTSFWWTIAIGIVLFFVAIAAVQFLPWFLEALENLLYVPTPDIR